jgi:hypothetical protein
MYLRLQDAPYDLDAAAAALAPVAASARAELAPADPGMIVLFLKSLADRHHLDLPDANALELDVMALADVPYIVLKKAFEEVWRTWRYRRLPTAGEIRAIVVDELQKGKVKQLLRLTELEGRLNRVLVRARRQAEASEHHARALADLKQREKVVHPHSQCSDIGLEHRHFRQP